MAGEGLNGSSNSAAKSLSNPYVGWTPQPLPQAICNSTERNETRVPTGFPLVSDLFGERGERKMGVQSQKRVTNSRAIRRRPEHQYKSSTASKEGNGPWRLISTPKSEFLEKIHRIKIFYAQFIFICAVFNYNPAFPTKSANLGLTMHISLASSRD